MSRRKSPSDDQVRKNFALKCRKWLRTAEEQRTGAKEMNENARDMCKRAEEMTKVPRRVIHIENA